MVYIKNAVFSNNGVAIATDGKFPIDMDHAVFDGNGIGILDTDQNLPADLAAAVIGELKASRNVKEVQRKFGERLKGYGVDLDQWLERGAHVATIIAAIAARAGLG